MRYIGIGVFASVAATFGLTVRAAPPAPIPQLPAEIVGAGRVERTSTGMLVVRADVPTPLLRPWERTYDPRWFEYDEPSVSTCFMPGSAPSAAQIQALEHVLHPPFAPRFNRLGGQWPTPMPTPNTPAVVTWSFVPDGVVITPRFAGNVPEPSTLFATMDAQFGGSRVAWVSLIENFFQRWSECVGITFVRITVNGTDWDNGQSWFTNASAGAGNIRIGARHVDGPGMVGAYGEMPLIGALVLDSEEDWTDSSNQYRKVRNVVMHEIGHTLGLEHVCPNNGTKLMELFLSLNYDGPQHDDVRGLQAMYGDKFEPNNTQGQAQDLGPMGPPWGAQFATESFTIPAGSKMSLANDQDVDWYKITMLSTAPISIHAIPLGLIYQSGGSACDAVSPFINTGVLIPLRLRLMNAAGTVLATDIAVNGAGQGDSADIVGYPLTPGTYYVVVDAAGPRPGVESQFYDLNMTVPQQPAPGNRTCAMATGLTPGAGFITGTTVETQFDGIPSSCGGNADLYPVWYSVASGTCEGTLTVTACSNVMNPVVAVYTACPGTAGSQVGCAAGVTGGTCGAWTTTASAAVTTGHTYWVRVAGVGQSIGEFSIKAAIVPTNDSCSSPTPIAPGQTITESLCNATNDYADACSGSQNAPDVWFSYTPGCSATMTVDATGTFDPVVSVLVGPCGSGLFEVACDNQSGTGTTAHLVTNAVAGQLYKIRVASLGGAGTVSVSMNIGEPNDLCVNAIAIGAGPTSGSLCGAGREYNETCLSRPSTSGDVWYRYVPTCNGPVTIDTCGAAFDTTVSVHAGPSCNGLAEVACNDDALPPCAANIRNSRVTVNMLAGQNYWVRVSGFDGATGSFTLNVSSAVVNDSCEGALVAGLGETAADTRCATPSGNAAACGNSQSAPDLWYTYTPTCTVASWLDMCGSTYDNVLSVYSGTCGGLTLVACDDDRDPGARPCGNQNQAFIAFRPDRGAPGPYYVRISGHNGASGQGYLFIKCCEADYNLSGSVTVADIFAFLTAWFAHDATADVDNSGSVLVHDIFVFLGNWFGGC